jgi:SAM-dependent methyltransferase
LRYKIDSILDIGCGPGQFALFLQDKGFRRYLGLDLSEVAVKMAREKCPSFEFIRSDIYESSILEDGAFDIVICLEVLEHLEKDIEILKRIASNTRFIGSVPNYNSAGHLRYFANKAEVETRYQELFDKFSVEDYLLDVKGHKFYLMEGIRI